MIYSASQDKAERDLPAVVGAAVRGEASAQELLDVWLGATVFCQRPDRPGMWVAETEDGPVVGVCSSLEELARFAGVVEWFSTTGADLLSLLPPGVDIVLDPAGPCPVRLHPGALRARPGLRFDRVGGKGAA
ncbi:SseB family protein [Streptomyces sp. HB2AG]|uniref:SseB family protein n=1 Tax=Streptomyces sp. HB2AG TaxID=2983400 RepID=UPI0022AAA5DC|nr:SseB family protein [Streptomyces sp. HB2AG]MCZ2525919.1 SseB family protein [Streptomyces sp. HB2AG]